MAVTRRVCSVCGFLNGPADAICRSCGSHLTAGLSSFPALTYQTKPGSSPANYDLIEAEAGIGPVVSFGSLLKPTFKLFTRKLGLITKLSFVIFAPFEVFKALSAVGPNVLGHTNAQTFILDLFARALLAPSLIYALVKVTATGDAPSLNDCFRLGLSKLPRLIVCLLLVAFLEVLGFICLVIPGIFLWVAFQLIYPIVALENRGAFEIPGRSYRLTTGHRGSIFFAAVVLYLSIAIVNQPLGLISTFLVTYGIDPWPLTAGLALVTDIVSQVSTVFSLVVYLSILKQRSSPL